MLISFSHIPSDTLTPSLLLQVYAESWLLHSQIKTDIRVQVRNLKSLFPNSFDGDPQELQFQIKDMIRMWVNDGLYLHGSVPYSVCGLFSLCALSNI